MLFVGFKQIFYLPSNGSLISITGKTQNKNMDTHAVTMTVIKCFPKEDILASIVIEFQLQCQNILKRHLKDSKLKYSINV